MELPLPPPKHPSIAAKPIVTTHLDHSNSTSITVEPPTPVAHQQEGHHIGLPANEPSRSDSAPLTFQEDLDDSSDPSTDDSDEDDEDEQAALRRVASELIEQSPILDNESGWSTGIGGWTGLRRRGTQRSPSPYGQTPPSVAPSRALTPREEEIRLALEELEDVEVATFLARASKRVQQVNVLPASKAPVYPSRASFTSDEGKMDWFAFGTAYLMTLAEAYCPPALLAPPRHDDLSIKFVRGELERFYVLAPPARVNEFLTDDVCAIWRWESPSTWKWCLLYTCACLFDLVPIMPFAIFAYYIMRVRMYPPTPQELLAESSIHARRVEQAARLSKQLKASHRAGYAGMALSGAKGLVSQLRKRAGTTSSVGSRGALASALEASANVGGLGGVRVNGTGSVGRNESLESDKGLSEDFDPGADDDEDVSLFHVFRDMARTAGPSGQDIMEQCADLGEKVKNVILHPEHPSVPTVLFRLVAICLVLIVTPAWIQYKVFFLYLGVEFFALWRLRELLPRYRRALTPIWWILLGAPTDAQLAAWIMRKRHLEARPILGRKTLKRKAKRLTELGDSPSASMTSLNVLSTRSRSNSAASSVESLLASRSDSIDEREAPVLSSHFALHMAVPGELILTSDTLKFVAMRSLRTIAPGLHKMARKWDKYQKQRETKRMSSVSSSDAETGSARGPRPAKSASATLKDLYEVKLRVDDIIGIKKESTRLLEGITIRDKKGREWKFTNIARRDEAFNRLVSLTPSTLRASSFAAKD
ncbi:hypothetical protein OIO90_003066 [Microbotryomycetes sp. JL221]|nr:hypothetical protein OIO90_003066 [Microbotryomycetes sp. JL221]